MTLLIPLILYSSEFPPSQFWCVNLLFEFELELVLGKNVVHYNPLLHVQIPTFILSGPFCFSFYPVVYLSYYSSIFPISKVFFIPFHRFTVSAIVLGTVYFVVLPNM